VTTVHDNVMAASLLAHGAVSPPPGGRELVRHGTSQLSLHPHTRVIRRHTYKNRAAATVGPNPVTRRRDAPRCEHGRLVAGFARHEDTGSNASPKLVLVP
jgi:hypothetical protein